MRITPCFRSRTLGLAMVALLMMLAGCRDSPTGELLSDAAYRGDGAKVDQILARAPGAANYSDPKTGMTVVELAIIGQHFAIAKTLLEHGADANATDKMGMNPFAHAVRKGDMPAVQLLLDHGARIKGVCFMKERVTPVMIAAIMGDRAMVEHLLALGADRTAHSAEGMTAAVYARKMGHVDVAQLLENPRTTMPTTR